MDTRLTIALIIQIVAILFSFIGWVDALEGGAVLSIVFRVAAVAVIAGSVFYAIRIGDTRRNLEE